MGQAFIVSLNEEMGGRGWEPHTDWEYGFWRCNWAIKQKNGENMYVKISTDFNIANDRWQGKH